MNSNSKFKVKVMKESHDSPAVGHVGLFKYYYNARRSFFWTGMQKYIQQYVAECTKFQRNKSEIFLTPGLLHPLHIPNQKWEEISMDFIDGLPPSEGKEKILVVVNRLTKFAHFLAIKNTDMTKQIADIFCKNVYKLHGLSRVIVSDIDVKFNGKFCREISNKWSHH